MSNDDRNQDAARRSSIIVRRVWAFCLLVAGANHARILLQHGLAWDYGGLALPSVIYLSSLTILDPLAAALLFVRPRVGIVLTMAIIVSNVPHNLAVTAFYAPDGAFWARAANPFVLAQIGFLLLVLATVRTAWRGLEPRQASA